jgi:dipeptidyl-peptidase-4
MTRRLTIADIVRQPLPGMDAPVKIGFTPDAAALLYLQAPAESIVRSLWRHDLASGERMLLAGPADGSRPPSRDEELRRERMRERGGGVTDYQQADDGTLLVPLSGRLYVTRAAAPVHPLPSIDEVQDARLSPDGRHIAFVRGGDVHVVASDGDGGLLQLTHDAGEGVQNGVPEYVAAEELGRHAGMWWSADSALLAYAHVDEREVAPYLIQHLGQKSVEVETHRYPFAGGRNARVSLRIGDPLGGTASDDVDLGMQPDDYLARVVAHPHGGWLVAVLPRDQRSLRWLRVDASNAATELWVERSTPWLNLDDDTRVLSDGRIMRSTERTGFRHLELRLPDGTFDRQLTSGEWVVTGVVHIDEGRDEVLFTGTRDGVLERHVYATSLAGGEPARLSDARGWHAATASRDGSLWVDSWSSLDQSPAVALRFRDAPRAPLVIHSASESAVSVALPPPELRQVTAADGTTSLSTAIYRPADRADGDLQPPAAVVWVYGGPHSQKVADEWSLTVELHRQMLRQLGFVVVVVDNRGTAHRGLAFEAPLWRQLGEVEIADQAAAVRQLAAEGVLDAARVGITGASYGGFLSLMAMLREPDLFRVGVAAAPVTHWRLYDSADVERYLGTPEANADGYDASSLLALADNLRGPALVIHGLVDENVHFRHTARLLSALAAADRDVDLLVFPDERHGERGAAARRQRQRQALGFLCRHLGRPLPPDALDGD